MNQFLKEALEKLSKPIKGDRYAQAMGPSVAAALKDFCQQDSEFAQAVAQGGSLDDCLKAVAKGVKNQAISDLDAYKLAAEFYFPGCVIEFQMKIRMSEYDAPGKPESQTGAIIIDLADFLG